MSPRALRAMAAAPRDPLDWMTELDRALSGAGPALLPVPVGPAAVRDALLEAFRPDDPSAPLESGDIALVVPTSGSTGEPKGALLTSAALRASAAATHARLGGAGSWVLALPLTHIAGLMVLVRGLEGGGFVGAVDLSNGFDPREFASVTAEVAGSADLEGEPLYTALVPTQLARLLDAEVDLSAYTAILVGAAAAPESLLGRARAAGARVVTTYGRSETCGGCVYDGQPLDGTSVAIDHAAAGPSGAGRVVLGGPTLFAGYRLRPDLDAAAFDPSGRFVTGDLGRLDAAGRLQLLGRADDVIITGGENVAPASVEAALADLPGVLACAVIGSPDREWGQVVVAVIACAPAAEPSLELHAVRAALSGRLPASWLPRRLVRVPSIPLLSTGKPDRAALAALAALAQPKER